MIHGMDGQKKDFYREALSLALPVSMQSMLQSSFSIVDQLMIGQLGSVSIAAVGLAAKFVSVFNVIAAAVFSASAILISQYVGKNSREGVSRSFFAGTVISFFLALCFTLVCSCAPSAVMRAYSDEPQVIADGCAYLRIISVTFMPYALCGMTGTFLRCTGRARIPLYAAFASSVVNTVLNYVLIFGRVGIPSYGVRGAAVASSVGMIVSLVVMLVLIFPRGHRSGLLTRDFAPPSRDALKRYGSVLLPVLVCETLWIFGENVYGMIYGHLGHADCAAMTLSYPVQGLMIGAMSGLSQAAGVLAGKRLGAGDFDRAYDDSRRLVLASLVLSAALSVLLFLFRGLYVRLYNVDDGVRASARAVLAVFALVQPVKVLNMVLGGGIVRSGGKTKIIMWIDICGTWLLGVPLGLLAAFVLRLPVPFVYLLLSLEECARLFVTVIIFRRKTWMERL